MSRKPPLAGGETSRTACARAVLRTAVDEKTGELLPACVLAERVGWCADLVAGMAGELLACHWNAGDVDVLASGEDAGGRKLPPNAWMALRRLGWTAAPPGGIRVNDRIARMAQEQAGRTLRSAKWRADLTAGVLAVWPASPAKRTPREWDQVRGAIPGGQFLPGSVIKSRTRQVAAFKRKHGRLPAGVFELEPAPRIARLLLLSACDGQQATIERHETEPGRALLRLQLPTRPDPRSYADWTWVACPLKLPPVIPVNAVLHLPTLRIGQGAVRADLAYTHAVPKAQRSGHTVALGVDWGLNTLLSAGAARLQRGYHARAGNQPGPVQDRTHPAPGSAPRAQATQGTLPHRPFRSGGPASGGTRSHGPEPAAPRSPPVPGRDGDQHTHQPAPAARSSTGRGFPPARPRYPTTVGRTRARHYL